MKFDMGRIVVTPGIEELMDQGLDVLDYVTRHVSGDWGDMSDGDKNQNEVALISSEDRLFSAYETSFGKIWIITEWDRSATTVLLPEEY